MKTVINLTPESDNEVIQALYDAGLTQKQIEAIARLIVLIIPLMGRDRKE